MGFLTRIRAEHLSVSYTHYCLVSTSGFHQALCINRAQVLPKARSSNEQEVFRARIGLAPVLFPSSSSRYYIVFCDVDRHRDEQPLYSGEGFPVSSLRAF
ncbi:hypothetical protein Acr_07g0012500 [Actinidia rufa]|uniref:Uncharacterized protein n=1 Tax=Actinidia rufa TaxID=165716 RepID=A0A7J0EX49_9ERIC|nr:hypothetical protein Acr_07g0012500 [Actinidia rufa]